MTARTPSGADTGAEPAGAFTPGPWMVPARMVCVVSEGSWHTIAQCGPQTAEPNWTLRDLDTIRANARLIAAAPDLLEASRDALSWGGKIGAISSLRAKTAKGRDFEDFIACREAASAAAGCLRAAIAKALGREAASPAEASSGVEERGGWRPIESAPRDGTTVLLWAPHWNRPLTGWTFGEDAWQDCRKDAHATPPTHFMPLPSPPTAHAGPESLGVSQDDQKPSKPLGGGE